MDNIDLVLDSSLVITSLRAKEIISNYKSILEDSINNVLNTEARFHRRLKNLSKRIDSDFALIQSYSKAINKYLVELHKKFSIPFASIVFILIGAPLGMMARKG